MPTTRGPVPVFVIARAGGWYWGPDGWTQDIEMAERFYGHDGWPHARRRLLTDPLHKFECFIHCYDWSL